MLTMKFSKDLCLVCSTCAMFFNSSLTVSMIAFFLFSSLSDVHQCALHVVPQFRDELYAVDEEPFKEVLSDISLVCHEFSVDEFHEGLVFEKLTVINVAWRYHEVEQLALLVADQMQPETEEPAHGTLTPLGNSLKRLVYVYSLVLAHMEWWLSTELMPVHLPSSTFLMNNARGIATSRPSSTNRLYETTRGNK